MAELDTGIAVLVGKNKYQMTDPKIENPAVYDAAESVLRLRAGKHAMSVLPSYSLLVSCRRLFVGSLYIAQVDNSDASESDLQADADTIALCWNAAPILAQSCNEKDAEIIRLRAELAEEKRKVEVAEQAVSQAFFLVTGNSPRWSDGFGHTEALEDIKDAIDGLKAHIQAGDKTKERLIWCVQHCALVSDSRRMRTRRGGMTHENTERGFTISWMSKSGDEICLGADDQRPTIEAIVDHAMTIECAALTPSEKGEE